MIVMKRRDALRTVLLASAAACTIPLFGQAKVSLGTVDEISAKTIVILAGTERIRFVVTPRTTMPAAAPKRGDRVRVFYQEADVRIATVVEAI